MTTRIIESVQIGTAPDALWREIGGFGAIGRWHCVYWGWFGFRVLQRNEYHR